VSVTVITSLDAHAPWPDRPGRMDEAELASFREGRTGGAIFVSDDLPHAARWRLTGRDARYQHELTIAFPLFKLALALRGLPPESFLERFGVLWEWRDGADKLARLDDVVVPVFLASARVLDVDDWAASRN